MAIAQSSGEVFVADGGSVQRFAPTNRSAPSAGYVLGSPLAGSFLFAYSMAVDNSCYLHNPALTEPACKAFDPSNGDVYVVEDGAVVVKFDAAGSPVEVNPPSNTTNQFGAGATPEALTEAGGVAVDPANGNVYVADERSGVVDIFTPAGEFVSQFAPAAKPKGLAFNSTGSDLYVANTGGRVEELEASGAPVEQTAGPNKGTNIVDNTGAATALAVDTSNNDVYVDDETSVAVYEASGEPIGSLGFPTGTY
ncbi:MAG: hypothetical protein ABSH36_09875, partial [Solirubrobacteraceae bacterium]